MADLDFADAMIRAGLLSGDALQAMTGKAALAAEDISDDLARELYGFFSGVGSGLAMCGRPEGYELLNKISNGDARDDPAAMRQVITGLLGEVAA
jgi:hypothetical protein